MNTSQVDSKVVQMQFDNHNFEKNVQSTIKTLENLESKLQFKDGTKGIDQVQDKFDKFTTMKIEKGLVQVQDHFSVMNTVAFAAISNITNSVVNLGKAIAKNIISPITSGGLQRALNIQQANFQLAGLSIERTGGVNYYKEVMDAVQGTAYSYDVAAKAASQLAASEIGVTKQTKTLINGTKVASKVMNKDMYNSILGIAGVSAMTNSSFEDISRIFTRVAGQGRVMATDLNSISARGINAAATLADYLTKVGKGAKVTEADVREMVSDGKISFDIFSKAMTDAFGAHAKDSTQVFTGAIEDMKAALARIGADFYTPALEGVRRITNSFTPLVDEIHESLNPALETTASIIDRLTKKATGVLSSIVIGMKEVNLDGEKFNLTSSIIQNGIKSITDSTKDLKGGSIDIIKILSKQLNKSVDETKEALDKSEVSLTDWSMALDKFANSGKKGSSEVKTYLADMNKELSELEEVSDSTGSSAKAISAGMDLILNKFKKVKDSKVYAAVGEKLNLSSEELKDGIEKGTISLYDFRNALKELQKEGTITSSFFTKVTATMDDMVASDENVNKKLATSSYILGGISNILGGFKQALSILGKTFNNIFSSGNGSFLNNFAESFYNISKVFVITEDKAKKLEKVFSILFKPLELGVEVIKKLFSALTGLASAITGFKISSLSDGFWGLVDAISNAIDKLIDFVHKIEELPFVQAGINSAKGYVEGFKQAFPSIISNISAFFINLIESIKSILGIHSPSRVFKSIGEYSAEGFGKGFIETIINIFSKIIDFFEDFINNVKKTFEKVKAYTALAKAFAPLIFVLSIIPTYLKAMYFAWEKYGKIKDIGDFLRKTGDEFKNNLSDKLKETKNSFNDFVSDLSKKVNQTKEYTNAILALTKAFAPLIIALSIIPIYFKAMYKVRKTEGQIKDFAKSIEKVGKEFKKSAYKTFKKIGIDSLDGYFKGLIDKSSDILGIVSKIFFNIIETVKDVLGIKSPSRVFAYLGEMSLKGFSSGFVSALADTKSEISKAFGKLIETISDKLKSFDFDQLFAIGIAGGTFFGIFKFIRMLSLLVAPIGSVTSSLSELFESISVLLGPRGAIVKDIKADALKRSSEALKNLAEALALLVGSIVILANVPTDKLVKGTLALAFLAGVLIAFLKAVEKIVLVESSMAIDLKDKKFTSKGANSISATLISMGASLVLIAVAFEKVAKACQGKEWYKPIIGFLSMLAITLGFFALIGKVLEKNQDNFFNKIKGKDDPITTTTKSLMKIATSMILLATAMKMISKLSVKDIAKSGFVITGFFAMIVAFQKGLAIVGKGSKVKVTDLNLLQYAAALALMIVVAKMANGLSIGEIVKGMAVIIALEACVVALIGMMSLVQVGTRINVGKVGKTILGISVGIILLAYAMKIISGISIVGIAKSISALTTIMIAIGGLMLASSAAGKYAIRAGVMILAVSGAIVMISAAMLVLGNLKSEKLAKALISVEVLLFTLKAIIESMVGMSGQATLAASAMAKIVVVIGLLSGVLVLFSLISPKRYLPAIAGVSLVLYTLSIVFKEWARVLEMAAKNEKPILRAVLQVAKILVSVAGIFGLFGLFLNIMDSLGINGNMILKAGIGVSLILASVSLIAKELSIFEKTVNMKQVLSAGAKIIGIATILASVEVLLGAFLIITSKYGVSSNDILRGAEGLSILFLAITIVMKAVTKMSKAIKGKDIKEMVIKLTSSLLAIAALLFIVSSTFGKAMISMVRAGVTGNDMLKGAGAFAILMLGLTIVIKSVSKSKKLLKGYNKGMFKSLITTMASISILFGVVAFSFAKSMAYMSKNGVNGNAMIKGATAFSILMGALTVVIAGLSLVASVIGKSESIGKVSRGLRTVLLSISALLFVVASTFGKSMIEMTKAGIGGNGILKGAEAFAILLGALTVVIAALTGISALLSHSKSVGAIVGSLTTIILELSILAAVVMSTFAKSMIDMVKAGVGGNTMELGARSFAIVLVALTAVVSALIGVSAILSMASPETIKAISSNMFKMIGAISILVVSVMGSFAASMSLMAKYGVSNEEIAQGTKSFTILLGALTGVILALSGISAVLTKVEGLKGAVKTISIFVLEIAGLMLIVSGTFAASMIAMSQNGVSGSAMIKGAEALALLLTSLTSVMIAVGVLAKFTTPDSLANMGRIIIAMAALDLVITAIFDSFVKDMTYIGAKGNEIVKMAASLAIVLNSLVPAFVAITLLSPILSNPASWIGMIAGIAFFDAFLLSLIGTIALIGKLASPTVKANIENGMDVFSILYEGLGKIVGSFFNGLVRKAGGALGEVLEVIVPLLERMQDIKSSQSAVTAIERLMKALTSFKTEGLSFDSSKIEGISDIATEIRAFVKKLGKLSEEELTALDISTKALYRIGKFMQTVKELDQQGVFKQSGKDKVSSFQTYLDGCRTILVHLNRFYSSSAFNTTNGRGEEVKARIEAATTAMDGLKKVTAVLEDAANYADKSGIFDNSQFRTYITGMENVLKSLSSFIGSESFKVKDDNSNAKAIMTKVKAAVKATEAIKTLSEACKNLNTGFFVNTVSRLNEMGDIMGKLGTSLVDFSKKIPDLTKNDSYDKVDKALKVLKRLSEVSKTLGAKDEGEIIPDYSALVPKVLQSTSSLSQLADDMKALGEALDSFAKSTSGFTQEKVDQVELASQALEAVGKAMQSFKDLGEDNKSFSIFGDETDSSQNAIDLIKKYSGILPKIGTAFAKFTSSITSFTKVTLTGGKQKVTNSVDQIKQAIEALNSISELAKNGTNFENITNLGDSLKTGIEGLTEIKPEDATTAGQVIGNFVKSFDKNSITTLSTLLSSFKKYSSEGFGNLGSAIQSIISSLDGSGQNGEFNLLADAGNKDSKAAKAGSVIKDFVNSMNESDVNNLKTLMEAFAGKTIDATKLSNFGTNFVSMLNGLSIKPEEAQNKGKVLNYFISAFHSNVATDMESFKSFVDIVNSTKYSNMSQFGTAFNTLIGSLTADEDSASTAATIIRDFGGLGESVLTNFNTFVTTISSGNYSNFKDFGDAFGAMLTGLNVDGDASSAAQKITDFVSSLKITKDFTKFMSAINGTSYKSVETFATSFNTMIIKLNSINNDSGQISDAAKKIKSFSDGIGNNLSNLKSFIDLTANSDFSKIADFGTSYTDMMTTINDGGFDGSTVATKISSFADNIDVKAIRDSLDVVVSAIEVDNDAISETWKKTGKALVTGLSTGMKNNKSKVIQAFADVNKIKTYAQEGGKVYQYYQKMGTWLSAGLAAGIRSKKSLVSDAAVEVAKEAYKAAKKELKINSPSKKFIEIGKSCLEGFTDGFKDKGSNREVTLAARKSSMFAISEMQKAIDISAELLESVDATPVITPVVDLDNVYAASAVMGNILDLNPTSNVGSTIANANLVIDQKRQNGNNSDVVSAIGDLKDKIKDSGNTTNNYIGEVRASDNDAISQAIEQLINVCIVEGRA